MSKWKDAYDRYRDLKSNWQWDRFPISILLFSESPEKKVQVGQISGLETPDQRTVQEVLQIRQVLDEAFYAKFPLEDVYQAALYMIRDPYGWSVQPDASKVYRGQRCHCWSIVPKLFRDKPCQKPSQEEIDSELTCLASLSEALKHEYPQYNEYQRIAIAQHYSEVARVKTWLVDLTWDPWVALFFASLDGCSGDIGNVVCFSRKEWEHLSAGGKNRLGAIRLIEAQGVPRMETQKAVFLDGSHPDLIEQYVAIKIKFHHKDGLLFEDPLMGITKEKLLFPGEDPFLVFIAKWKATPQKSAHTLTVKPANDAARPLQPDDYLEIALSWVERRKTSLSPERMNLLKKVCAFHWRLQEKKKAVNITARSLRRLAAAVDYILILGLPGGEIRARNLKEAIRDYLDQADEDSWLVIMKVLSEIEDSNSY